MKSLPLTFVPFDHDLYRSSIRRFFDIAIGDERSYFKAITANTFAIFTPPNADLENYEFEAGLYIGVNNPEAIDIYGGCTFTFPNIKTLEEAEEFAEKFYYPFEIIERSEKSTLYKDYDVIKKVESSGGIIHEYYESIYSFKNTRAEVVMWRYYSNYNGEKEIFNVEIRFPEATKSGGVYYREKRENTVSVKTREEAEAIYNDYVKSAV